MAEVVLVLTWAAVLLMGRGAWGVSATPARRALWVALLALALGWTLRVPADYRGFDALLEVPNVAQPIGDGLALATGCAILAMLLYQSHERAAATRKLRLRVAALVVALVVIGIAFAQGHPGDETNTFVTRYGTHAFFLAYSSAYLGYLAYVFSDLTRLCHRYAGLSDRRFLKVGLRLIEAAGVLGLCYVALRAAYLISDYQGDANHFGAYEPLSKLVVATLTLLAVVGAVLPAIATRLAIYRSYRQLHPLWKALYRATPGIALAPPPSKVRELLSFRDLRFRLNSRIIEIRDGRLALRRYFRRDVAARAERIARQRGLTGAEQVATVEAATLAAAVDDKLLGRPAPVDPAPEPVAPGGADLAGEVTFLRRVTRAYTRSRVVRETVSRDGR